MYHRKNQKVSFYCFYGQQQRIYEDQIEYNFQVKGSISYHQLQIRYKNKTQNKQNFSFSFDLSEDSCFDYLQIKIGEKVINCLVKEKEEAKEEYQKAVRQGKAAALGSFEEKRGKFQIQIGNVEKDEEFFVSFKYIEQLTLQGDLFQMTLPFIQNFNAIVLNNLKINGDVYAQTENQCIVSTEFDHSKFNQLIKYQQVSDYHTKITAEFSNEILRSVFQNTFNLEYLRIKYDQNNLTLLSSYQNDSEISPYCVLLNYVPHVAQVKKSLAKEELIKAEFLLIIDRSGSMSGTSIETAKQSLIFFLKSMPEGSIYNIISFGSGFLPMYPQSVQFNDQNLQDSIDKIEKFSANMGGTNISQALKYLMDKLQDQYGLRKKIFIITDGAFGDYEQALEIVRKNKERCDINALCIGSFDFQYATQLVSETGGNIQQVSNASQIIPKVIQLLKDSFKNYDSVQMSLTSDHEDCINYIVPHPQQICYIDTSKTLRFYIFLNRKLEEVQQIKFKLTTTYNGNQKLQSEYVVDIKNQISNEFAHIHKMGLYQLIRQVIINQSRKCENILDDISVAMKYSQNEMIELLKNEAIRYQILCEFTAFVGTQTTQEQEIQIDEMDQQNIGFVSKSIQLSSNFKAPKDAACCGGGSGYSSSNSSKDFKYENQNEQKSKKNDSYSKIIMLQSASGLWQYTEDLVNLLNLSVDQVNTLNPISSAIQQYQSIWITIIVAYWISKFFQDKSNQHQYILLKAYKQIDRLKKENSIEEPTIQLKKLFENYKLKNV